MIEGFEEEGKTGDGERMNMEDQVRQCRGGMEM